MVSGGAELCRQPAPRLVRWSDTDDRYRGVRIIFIDTELSNWAWDPVSED